MDNLWVDGLVLWISCEIYTGSLCACCGQVVCNCISMWVSFGSMKQKWALYRLFSEKGASDVKKSAWSIAVFVALSLVLTGCGLSAKSGANSVNRSAEGSTPHRVTGTRTASVSSGRANKETSGQTGIATKGGSKPTQTSVHADSSKQTGQTGTTPVAFSALHAGPLTAVWFATPAGTAVTSTNAVSSNTTGAGTNSAGVVTAASPGSAQVGYVTDAHHVYRTKDGGKTWRPVVTVSQSLIGVTSDASAAGNGLTVAWTPSQLWLSADGTQFALAKVQLPASGLTQVSVAGGVVWLLDAGTLYRDINGVLQTVSSAAIGSISGLTAVGPSTCYVVAASTAVFETTDGGGTWQQLFWPPLNGQLPWQTQIDVSGNHIVVLYANGDSGVNQSAYIAVASNDGGKTWNPLFENPSFAGDYGNPTPLVQQNLGNTALLFALLPSGNIVFVGEGASAPKWTVVTPQGQVQNTFAMKAGGPVIWPNPATAALSASGGAEVVLVGGDGSHAVIDMTPSSGVTWDTLS